MTDPNKPEEQRKDARSPCSVDADCTTWNSAFRGSLQNISAGGVFIETKGAFGVGDEITLTFSTPNHQDPVKIVGEIVWHVPQGIGVKFKTPGQELEAVIKSR